jgi:hypothetical protein
MATSSASSGSDTADQPSWLTRKSAKIPRHISLHSQWHAAITDALDAGVPLRDAQTLARDAHPRTNEHHDRARGNLNRHGVHLLTAHVAGVRTTVTPFALRMPIKGRQVARNEPTSVGKGQDRFAIIRPLAPVDGTAQSTLDAHKPEGHLVPMSLGRSWKLCAPTSFDLRGGGADRHDALRCHHGRMSGVDTVRGIGYQHAQSVLTALEVLRDANLQAIRVEGVEDVLDIEVHDARGRLVHAKQVKIRDDAYTWGEEELLNVLRRWAALNLGAQATFEFLTDGRLGPTGEAVRSGLVSASNGDLAPIATILGVASSDPICTIVGRASIRQEPAGVENVLKDAEREIRTMLANRYRQADLDGEARAATERLLTLLSTRAGLADPAQRVVPREEIGATLGGLDRIAATDQWPGSLAAEYLGVASGQTPDVIRPILMNVEDGRKNQPPDPQSGSITSEVPRDSIVGLSFPALLSGPTGSGKTTAAEMAVYDGANSGRVVLLAHAETYSAARLSGLAADALAQVLRREFSTATGLQVISDSDVILIIDGVSEVPEDVRVSLQDELAVPLSAGVGASIVLAGRDVAKLAGVLPTTVAPSSYQLSGFSFSDRREVAQRRVEQDGGDDASHSAHRLASQVEHALGDAAGNPMLFTMAVDLLISGSSFEDRAGLYADTIQRLGRRGGATDVDLSSTVLGVVFATLLDEGKRFANPYEWTRLLNGAAADLRSQGFEVSPVSVRDAARRSGLVVPIGYTQTQAPLHDSFADYLAGLAHARGHAPLPASPATDDEQRLLFTAEVGGVNTALASLTANALPFSTVRMSNHDRRPLGAEAPLEITQLLRALAPTQETRNIALHRVGNRTMATLVADEPSWLSQSPAVGGYAPVLVCEPGTGPMTIAVRMWRTLLRSFRQQTPWLEPSRFEDPRVAAAALSQHSVAVAEQLELLVSALAPCSAESTLRSAIGPFGLTAFVESDADSSGRFGWPVRYRASPETLTQTADQQPEGSSAYETSSTVEYLMRQSPQKTAYERVSAAINTLTQPHWL